MWLVDTAEWRCSRYNPNADYPTPCCLRYQYCATHPFRWDDIVGSPTSSSLQYGLSDLTFCFLIQETQCGTYVHARFLLNLSGLSLVRSRSVELLVLALWTPSSKGVAKSLSSLARCWSTFPGVPGYERATLLWEKSAKSTVLVFCQLGSSPLGIKTRRKFNEWGRALFSALVNDGIGYYRHGGASSVVQLPRSASPGPLGDRI